MPSIIVGHMQENYEEKKYIILIGVKCKQNLIFEGSIIKIFSSASGLSNTKNLEDNRVKKKAFSLLELRNICKEVEFYKKVRYYYQNIYAYKYKYLYVQPFETGLHNGKMYKYQLEKCFRI